LKRALSKLIHYPAPVRIVAFVLVLLLVWTPVALPIYWLVKDSNTASILTLVTLYGAFIFLVRWWGRWVYHEPNLLWRYGLECSRRMGLELLTGLAIGVFSVAALFITQGVFGWVLWQSPSIAVLRIVLEGLLVALGFGFAEELLFRGWLLDELQRDYRLSIALVVNATIFALVHGLKPQFPALFLLAVTLILAKRSHTNTDSDVRFDEQGLRYQALTRPRGRLGLPMGLHAGLVWGYYIVNVGQLVKYAPQVPEWLTGFDRNPLAGAVGILFLSALAAGLWRYARRQRTTEK
jgi:uncharacterized protein